MEGSLKVKRENLGEGMKIKIKETPKSELKGNDVIIKVRCVLKGINDKSGEVGVTVTTVHELIYSSTGDHNVTQAFLDKFNQFAVSMTVWPFFREFVQNMITRASLPALTLPVNIHAQRTWLWDKPRGHDILKNNLKKHKHYSWLLFD